jgi:O-antigen/teichoic acid export membrane protein
MRWQNDLAMPPAGSPQPWGAGGGLMNAVQRIARNSVAPIAAQLTNKVMDLGFTYVALRALGPEGTGAYDYAILVWLYVKTFSDFGLGILTTREVAQQPALAGEFLGFTTLLRLVLWMLALPVVALFAFVNWRWLGSSTASTIALLLLILSIVPDSWSDAANSICNAFEDMVSPALLTVLKNVLKVALGLALLAAGWGAIGLAATALFTNLATSGLFTRLVRRLGVRPVWALPVSRARQMLATAWPLLVNNLLNGFFFSVDAFVLKGAHGEAALGIYRAPYRFLSLLLLVPQYGTLALFPHLSKLAAERAAALPAAYTLAIKLLLTLALPICVGTLFVAPDLMLLLGGAQFLPDAGTALRLLIWFLPFSYVNGLVQYVLIAAGLQRVITPAFALTLAFNLGANLLLTPRYGFVAAAIITVASEVVLLVPFLWALRRRVGPLPEAGIALRPLLAATLMGAVAWATQAGVAAQGLARIAPWLAVAAGGAVYLLALIATGGVGATERRLALRLLGRGVS